jgi:hypothetical protein
VNLTCAATTPVTCSVSSPIALSNQSSTTATLTVNVPASTPSGSYNVLVTGKDVRFGRPLFNLRGTRVTSTELASGTVDDAGKLHMASDYVVLGFAVHGDYEGTIGAFTGTQSWQWPDGRRGSRTCVAALVPAPRATHPVAPQQQ